MEENEDINLLLFNIYKEPSLSEEKLYFNLCYRCGDVNLISQSKCKKCKENIPLRFGYPPLNALDVGYSLLIQKEMASRVRKGLVAHLKIEIEKKVELSIRDNDILYFIDQLESELSKNKKSLKLKSTIITRINCSEEEAIEIRDMIATGNSVNKFYKPFLLSVLSFVELIYKDFVKSLLIKKLGDENGKSTIEKYKKKSITSWIKLYRTTTGQKLQDKMRMIDSSFFDEWDVARGERNEIIHENNKYFRHDCIEKNMILAQKAVMAFAILNGELHSSEHE